VRFNEEFGRLERRLYAMLPARLQEERDLQRRAAIYRFPQQFCVSGPLIARFLEAAFGASRTQPLVRGVYFTSGTQEGSPIDRVLGTLARTFNLERKVQPPAPGTGKSYFLRRLLREVIFSEAGLAGVDAREERRRRVALAATVAAMGVGTLALATLWTTSYLQDRDLVATAEAATAAVQSELVAQAALRPGDETRMLAMLDRLGRLQKTVDLGRSFLRVGFGQSEKLSGQATRAYRNALRDTLLPHAVYSLEAALRRSASRELLDAYLAIYDQRRTDDGSVARVLMQVWALPEGAHESLALHVRAALEDRPLALPHARDAELVEEARHRLGPAARL
jgi:type VI secretion system protein ImpL